MFKIQHISVDCHPHTHVIYECSAVKNVLSHHQNTQSSIVSTIIDEMSENENSFLGQPDILLCRHRHRPTKGHKKTHSSL